MRYNHNDKIKLYEIRNPIFFAILYVFLCTFILAGIPSDLQAQEPRFTKPVWWFGITAGENFNFHRGSTQQLNAAFTAPVIFNSGDGAGLYLASHVEYQQPNAWWGIMLEAGYDNRKGMFRKTIASCNCPAEIFTNLNYISVEPSLRLTPFKSGFYLYAGPRFAYNTNKLFTYKQGVDPDFPNQVEDKHLKGSFSNIHQTLVSAQFGIGYDIPFLSQNKASKAVISPFASYQPAFGQAPRSVESWSLSTFRIGAGIKFGYGHKTAPPGLVVTPLPDIRFSLNSPKNIPVERRVRETFPVLNYVFFNQGSTQIPFGYVLLRRDQVNDFKENQSEAFASNHLSSRSKRGMAVYYNVLNILGDRMQKDPSASITLVGSSDQGIEDGLEMAQSIKRYLTDVFQIDGSMIWVEGREKPKLASEQPGGTLELDLLREEDRRVSIESNSPALLMEYQSGPDARLKPVEIITVQEAPPDSYVSFKVDGAEESFEFWSLQIKDEKGNMQHFGPYTQEQVSLPGKSILGARPEGDYKVRMVGQTKSGRTVVKESTMHMVLWTPLKNEEGMRFSVIFGFNESRTIDIYEKYLTDIVTPKIPRGGKVIIRGFTDIIGDESNNQTLSLARANEVCYIMQNSLSKAGRYDVTFEVAGFGENETLSPFENKYPEERFYNRCVTIDIIPVK